LRKAFKELHVDDSILVIDKPAGVPSVHDPARPEDDAQTLLTPRYGPLFVVHRLDKETSGVLLFARTESAHAHLSAQFESRDTEKVYHALVMGSPRWDERTIDAPLLPNGDRKHRTVVDLEDGKPSVTHARVLQRVKGVTLVEARPETGRTHQIRVHLATASAAIACDPLYGDGKPVFLSKFKKNYRETEAHEERPLLGRLGLHALRLSFTHPVSGERMTIEAPYPKDFSATLNQLGKLVA
jgi:RluA family pseudouridine synthase